MLNPLEEVTLYAFLVALTQIDESLPSQLQQEINKVGEIFATQPSIAVNYLVELAKHTCIKESYQQARENRQNQYEVREKNKYRDLKKESETNATEPETIENLAIAIPLEKIAQPILQASDSSAEAKKYEVELRLATNRFIQ